MGEVGESGKDESKVYYNLHKHFQYSNQNSEGWRVTGYADKLNLRDVEFELVKRVEGVLKENARMSTLL